MKRPALKNQEAFTLIEIMVVISIIAVLTSLVYASFGTVKAQSRDAKREADSVQMRTALASYSLDHNGVPSAASTTASGCSQSSTDPTVWTCSTATGVSSILAPLVTGGYISSIPLDPLNTGAYSYYYSTGPSTSIDPQTGTPLSPSGSFDYVDETETTSPNSPAVLGINAGDPDYTTYPGSGYPASIDTGGGGGTVATTTPPGQPAGLTANLIFNGSQFSINPPTSLLVAAVGGAGPPAQPTSATVNLSWTNTGGAATGYAVAANGGSTPLGTVTGTTDTDTVNLPVYGGKLPAYGASSFWVYTVKASNSAGTSSAATVAFVIPPPWAGASASFVDNGMGSGGIENISATVTVNIGTLGPIGTYNPAGMVYNLAYTNYNSSVKNFLGTVTLNSSGSGTFTYSNNATYNINLTHPPTFEADLESEPAIVGN